MGNSKLRAGDLVEIKSPAEIMGLLDSSGTAKELPFMREMAEYCGRRFTVAQHVVKVCASGMKTGSTLRAFADDDVVILEGLRCSGLDHDGCQKSCTIFWREEWLRKVDEGGPPHTAVSEEARDVLRSRLRTMSGPETYFCQASQLLQATHQLPKVEGYLKCIAELRVGNCGILEMSSRLATFLYWKFRRLLFGVFAKGSSRRTPTEALELCAGQQVRVKDLHSIKSTLDEKASNRGLWFSPGMKPLCGTQQEVERRIDKLIVDGSGEMRHMKNTVFLKGSFCGCPYIAFGGCSRREYVYWREVWLERNGAGPTAACDVQDTVLEPHKN